MKKLLSLLLAVIMLFSLSTTAFAASTSTEAYKTVAAENKPYEEEYCDGYFLNAFLGMDLMLCNEAFFTEEEGPSASFVHDFLWFKGIFVDKYLSWEENIYECKIPRKEYENTAFKYFQKSDRLVEEMRSDPYKYSNGKYHYSLCAIGGFSQSMQYITYKSLGKNKYEVYLYIYEIFDETSEDGMYRPAKKAKAGKDYLTFYNEWDKTTYYGKITGGVKSIVYFNAASAGAVPKYLSFEKVTKKQINKLISQNPASAKYIEPSNDKFTYNGKTQKPKIEVFNNFGTELYENFDYIIKYPKNSKNVGKYTITIEFFGRYSGKKTVNFEILPKKTSISKLTPDKKSLKVTFKKQTKQVTGYQVQYSTSKKFTNATTKTIKSNKTTSLTLKNLKAKKNYYVRVRTYKTVNGKKFYSFWSSTASKKTK